MIPAHEISRPALAQLVEYIRSETYAALADRRPLEERWIKYQQLYRAQPFQEVKEFPFYGASNLVIPLIATDVDIIFSRLMGILFQPDNLWSVRPLRPDMVNYAPRLEEFLKWAQNQELDAYNAIADWLLELTKLGTGILKQRYKREHRRVYNFRETPEGTVEEQVQAMMKNHPVLQHTSLYDFIVPATATDIQSAPWAGERLKLTWNQLQQRARAGIYTNVDHLSINHAQYKGTEMDMARAQMDSFTPGLGRHFEIWEHWLDFDISGIGEPVAIVATIHPATGTLLRVDYNPFFHQEKPYSFARFMRQEKRFYGIGLAEMLEMPQEEITAMHNQGIDSGTLANSQMYKARKGIGIRDDEPVFPGRWFLLDNMEDVQPMHMKSVQGTETLPRERQTLEYSTNRTGVNDYMMGRSTPAIGYGTAASNMLQHQEAAKRFDQTLREIRSGLSESGVRLLELYQQFDQGGKIYEVMGEKQGQVVMEVMQFPLELIRFGIGVDVTATSASLNKEVEIRTNMTIMQLMTQFYTQMLEGMQILLNPQLPPEMRVMVMQMMNGGNVLMRRILDSHGIQDFEELIPELAEILNGGQQQINSIQAALGGGNGGPPGVGQQPGMEAVGLGNGGAPGVAPAGAQGIGGF